MSPKPEDLEQLQKTIDGLPPSPARDALTKGLQQEVEALNSRLERENLRKTPWDALSVDQKLERMREIVKETERVARWHSRALQDLQEQIGRLHEHAHADGRVMIPAIPKHSGGFGAEACEQKVEGYF